VGNSVRPAGVKSCDKYAPVTDDAPQQQALVNVAPAPPPGFLQRAKTRMKSLFARK
jgi:hypothetical protein